jgi:hypothetical protein
MTSGACHSAVVHQNIVARVAHAMELRPRRLEVAPSKVNDRFAEFPALIVPGAAEVAVAVYSL